MVERDTNDSSVATIHRWFDAEARGDLKALESVFAKDFVLHFSGRSELAGDVRGYGAYVDWTAKRLRLLGSAHIVRVHPIASNDEYVVCDVTERVGRAEQTTEISHTAICRVRGNEVAEVWLREHDQYKTDELLRA